MVLIIREYCLMVKQLSFKQPMLGSIPAILNINPPPVAHNALHWVHGGNKKKTIPLSSRPPPLKKKGGGDMQN